MSLMVSWLRLSSSKASSASRSIVVRACESKVQGNVRNWVLLGLIGLAQVKAIAFGLDELSRVA